MRNTRYVMTAAQAHAVCVQRLREALAGENPYISLSERIRAQLTKSLAAHEGQAK